jgi:cyclic-di-GMP phosphodiesterase TipF (flagellum assembly factor)
MPKRKVTSNIIPLKTPKTQDEIHEEDKPGGEWFKQIKEQKKLRKQQQARSHKPALVTHGKDHNAHVKYDYDDIIHQSHALRFAHDATLSDIRSALRNKDLATFLQPTVDVSTRNVVHYECFTNMIAPDGQIIKPSEYLEKAKDAGLLPSIDSIVFTQTLERVMSDIKKIPSSWQKIFFNISQTTFEANDVFAKIETFFKVNRNLTHRMIFEISHTDFMKNPKAFLPYLSKMRGFGARLSLDNVKSFNIDIKALAPHNLSFIKIPADVLSRELKRALSDPLHPQNVKKTFDRAGITLIVEKVESENQVNMLKELNISLAQGYLFGFPAPIEELFQKENSTSQLLSAHG